MTPAQQRNACSWGDPIGAIQTPTSQQIAS
jgi:hypothetical protein